MYRTFVGPFSVASHPPHLTTNQSVSDTPVYRTPTSSLFHASSLILNHARDLTSARGDLAGALADFDKVIGINPRYARAYANRGMIFLVRREDAQAEKDFATAVGLDSSLRAELEKSIEQIKRTRKG